jgi:hypothetical protein
MAYLAIAYPTLIDSDYEWIQSVRQKYDRQFNIVRPHITLVFGTSKLNVDLFTEHGRATLVYVKSFPIILDSVKMVEDDSKKFFHAFLVPSDGFDEINKIHDRLYQGVLESGLRLEMLDDGRIVNQFERVYVARVPHDAALKRQEDEVSKRQWFLRLLLVSWRYEALPVIISNTRPQ